jgi:Fe-S oxidoreductase
MYKYFLDILPLFTIPFNIGLLFFLSVMLIKFFRWIGELSGSDRWGLFRGLKPLNFWGFIKESISECLLHLRIFRTNVMLGYMHTSLAFGWFLLIIVGNIEAKVVRGGFGTGVELPHFPIFLKYFQTEGSRSLPKTVIDFSVHKGVLDFLLDLLLLFILSGCILAYSKRFRSKTFGMKRTTKLRIGDKITMYSLWFIFPARLIAESITAAAYGGGSFLTGSLGNVFASFIPNEDLMTVVGPFWWMYSITLGAFFVGMPFSRYTHILSEPILIFMRHAGIKPQASTKNGFSQAEIFSCSRCGICIDTCQLASATNITNVQASYFIRNLRHHSNEINQVDNCLICGRCNKACPVKINIENLRLNTRKEIRKTGKAGINYLPTITEKIQTDVLYFAGCMTHLTPAIKNAMVKILETSGENFEFMDKDGSICCGRPLKLSGQTAAAQQLITANKERIINSGAKTLVTSCPICYRVFKEDYQLNIEVLHHTEYLLRLIEQGKISVSTNKTETVVYHDPCDLGRGSNIYEAPRQLIEKMMGLENTTFEKENALCCGGSLGNTQLSVTQRKQITTDAIEKINPNNKTLITACPLCKKTFTGSSNSLVMDVAQLVLMQMEKKEKVVEEKPILEQFNV